MLDRIPERNESEDATNNPDASSAPFRIFNIGKGSPTKLLDFVEILEDVIGKKAKIEKLPMQPGDVLSTHADTSGLMELTGYKPTTDLKEGVGKFVKWYKSYYKLS